MADMLNPLDYTSSKEYMEALYEKYKDKYTDSNADLVNSETFLNLLVAEMTNQDPLEPSTNTEFVSQMAQFTSLQYSQDASKYQLGTYANSLVGKTVTVMTVEGREKITKTGVVEEVLKKDNTYTIKIDGNSYDLSAIQSVSSTADSGANTAVSNLADTIARASMMVGMEATVKAHTDKGDVVDSGVIQSIQVQDNELYVVINKIAYKLTDVVEVKYADANGNDIFIDENGNYVDKDGNLVDKDGNRIDEEGNRIDEDGNIINPSEDTDKTETDSADKTESGADVSGNEGENGEQTPEEEAREFERITSRLAADYRIGRDEEDLSGEDLADVTEP